MMKYEELADEKISIFGYSEPLVPYEKAMEACMELIKERKKAHANLSKRGRAFRPSQQH